MLYNRIAQERRHLGLSQLQLARELKISPSAMGMYEQGRRTPDLQILIAMSQLFQVSLDYLITGEEFLSVRNSVESQIPVNCPCKTCFWNEHREK